MTVGEEEGCPDVEFDGVIIPECNVVLGVAEAVLLCQRESVNGLDCEKLLEQFEAEQISASDLMKTVVAHTDDVDIHFNMDMLRKVIKEEPLE